MKSWTWQDDQFTACDSVPLTDRGFRYGMSLFESILVRGGKPIFLREHLQRLLSSCARCALEVDGAALKSVGDLLRQDGFARVYVTSGDGTTTSAAENCRVFVFTEPREPIASRVYHRGYDLGVEAEPHQPFLGGLKTANYWANLDAFRRGVARQKNETLLFDRLGNLISACMANVFVVRNDIIQTPAAGGGARAGVVREWVLKRRAVVECALTRSEVETADEIFLTSSWLGVMPVATLENRPVKNPTACTLHREYEDALASGTLS